MLRCAGFPQGSTFDDIRRTFFFRGTMLEDGKLAPSRGASGAGVPGFGFATFCHLFQ